MPPAARTAHGVTARRSAGERALLPAAAVLSGLLAAAALPPLDLAGLAWVSWLPWLLALSKGPSPRAALFAGALHVATWNAASCSWMITTMTRHGGIALPLALLSFAVALLLFVPYGAVLGWATAALTRRFGPVGILGFVLLAPALDALRCRMSLGFPWALPGMTQVDGPALGFASLAGVHGVSLVVLAVNAAAALAVSSRSRRDVVSAALVALCVGGALVAARASSGRSPHDASRAVAVILEDDVPPEDARGIAARAAATIGWSDPGGGGMRVALVQGAVPQDVVLAPHAGDELARAGLQLDLTEHALASGAQLVVWSESAWPGTVDGAPWIAHELRRLLVAHPGSEALVGGVVEVAGGAGHGGDLTNSALLIDSRGLMGRYDKAWLVPFGEYVPARPVFFWFQRLVSIVGNFRAGRTHEPLPGRAMVGAFVCYEAVLPQHVAGFVRNGATLLVNVTNDGWFHGSSAPEQHLRFSVLRAVELERTVIRCANSGISAVIAPSGAILARLPEGRRGLVLATTWPSDERTLYSRAGDVPVALAGLAALAWVLLALRAGTSTTRSQSKDTLRRS